MEGDSWNQCVLGPSMGRKRDISNDEEEIDRDFKKTCTGIWPMGANMVSGSSSTHPSWDAQSSLWDPGFANTLQSDVYGLGQLQPYSRVEAPSLLDVNSSVPYGRPTFTDQNLIVSFPNDESMTYIQDSGLDNGFFISARHYEDAMLLSDQARSQMEYLQFSSSEAYDSSIFQQLDPAGQLGAVSEQAVLLPLQVILDSTTTNNELRGISPKQSSEPLVPMKSEYADQTLQSLLSLADEGCEPQHRSASVGTTKTINVAADEDGNSLGAIGPCEVSNSKCIQKDFTTTPYDACFGVVITKATSTFTGTQGTKAVPVNIIAFGDILKLYFQDSNKYAGLLLLPVLSRILGEFTISLAATIASPQSRQNRTTSKDKIQKVDSPQDCPVRIIVYGLIRERDAVSDLLSGAGLYLQHPSALEYDRQVEYLNPQYLLRPGSRMPKLEELTIGSDVKSSAASDSLDETNKSQLMRIFDSANFVGTFSQAKPSPRLRTKLKDHQLTALSMMTEKELGILEGGGFPSLWEVSTDSNAIKRYRHKITGSHGTTPPQQVCGGILADEMGLGKTLSLLALICWSLDMLSSQPVPIQEGVPRATLIIATKSTILEWQQQIDRHIHRGQIRVIVYHGSNRRSIADKLQDNDIVLTTYETLRSEWTANGALYSDGWARVVLDEAHHIRNRSSQTFKAACAIAALQRWCLTGTPIQNSLDDYGALLSFVGVPPFRDKSMFDFWIASPIKDKRPDSLRRLKDVVRATCLRRTKVMTKESLQLPSRVEKIESIKLHQADQELYNFFKLRTSKIAAGLPLSEDSTSGQRKRGNILLLINFLRLICNHGEYLLPSSALDAWRDRDSASIDWEMMRGCRKRCDACGADIEDTDDTASTSLEFLCRHSICAVCAIRSDDPTNNDRMCPKCATAPTGRTSLRTSGLPTPTCPSAKIEALLRNLHEEQTTGNQSNPPRPTKSVIFSYWTKMLDLIQQALGSYGFGLQRIDGQTSLSERSRAISRFNEDPNCTVLLASIGSIGEGVDLTAANNVHLMEPHWNPMAEAQAVDRVHRIGQTREVVTTRYITSNSIETYIQWVQQDKVRLISQSLDTSEVPQSNIDEERWKKLQLSLA